MKRNLINYIGLFGVLSSLFYILAVFISPFAYPGYDWMSQAVSDLSAQNAPSLKLWNLLSAPYGVLGLISLTTCCIFTQGKTNKILRSGIYLFTIMNYISFFGYTYFPLTESGLANTFQDTMHLVVTGFVLALSVISLVLLMIGGYRKKSYISLAIAASICLVFMMTSSISLVVPKSIFGIVERLSTLSATIFTGVIGIYLFFGFNKYSQNNLLTNKNK